MRTSITPIKNRIQIHEILQCPSCRGRIDRNLECLSCHARYHETEDIPVMVNPRPNKHCSAWDCADFETGRIESKLELLRRSFNQETRDAYLLWREAAISRFDGFSGLVAEVASGVGKMLGDLVSSRGDFAAVSADAEPLVLGWKRAHLSSAGERELHFVASDVRRFAFRDGTFDNIATVDSLLNICETDRFLAEMRRVLRPGGRLVVMHRFFLPESRSYALAKVYGIERNLERGPLQERFRQAGFTKVDFDMVSQAIWAENPIQQFPAAGDLQMFALVEATR